MNTIGEVIAKLSVLDPSTPAEFFGEGGITDISVAELLAWRLRREEYEALPGVAMANGDCGGCFRIMLPNGVRSFDIVDVELNTMFAELRATAQTLARLHGASFGFAMGPGAVRSAAWKVFGENGS